MRDNFLNYQMRAVKSFAVIRIYRATRLKPAFVTTNRPWLSSWQAFVVASMWSRNSCVMAGAVKL